MYQNSSDYDTSDDWYSLSKTRAVNYVVKTFYIKSQENFIRENLEKLGWKLHMKLKIAANTLRKTVITYYPADYLHY